MKALVPIPFQPGATQVQVPQDAIPVGVVMGDGGPVVLVQINPITAQAIRRVTWSIHGLPVGDGRGVPDNANYVGAVGVPVGPGEVVQVAAFVEQNVVLLPDGVPRPVVDAPQA